MLKVEGKRITTQGDCRLFDIVDSSVRSQDWGCTYDAAELTQLIDALTYAKGCIEFGEEVRFCPEPLKWTDYAYYSTAPGGWLVVMCDHDNSDERLWGLIHNGKFDSKYKSRAEAKAKAK